MVTGVAERRSGEMTGRRHAVCFPVPTDAPSLCERRHLQERSGAGPGDLRIWDGWGVQVSWELGAFRELQNGIVGLGFNSRWKSFRPVSGPFTPNTTFH